MTRFGLIVVIAAMTACAPAMPHRAAQPVEMVPLSPSQLEPAPLDEDVELHATIGTTEIKSGDPLPLPEERMSVSKAKSTPSDAPVLNNP